MPVPQQSAKTTYLLRLGDTALVLSQRMSQLCGKGPALEEDMAMANTALDLLGQARLWLSYAAEVEGNGRDEDSLAFLRNDRRADVARRCREAGVRRKTRLGLDRGCQRERQSRDELRCSTDLTDPASRRRAPFSLKGRTCSCSAARSGRWPNCGATSASLPTG